MSIIKSFTNQYFLTPMFSLLILVGFSLGACADETTENSDVDTFLITVDPAYPRLLKVEARLKTVDDILSMEWESAQFLEAGWATFVDDLKVYTSEGKELGIEHILPAKWKISGEKTDRIHLKYNIRLSHDYVAWEEGGHSEAAYVLDNLLLFLGRAVFITSAVLPEEYDDHQYLVKFQIPDNYQITNQWDETEKENAYLATSTMELVNSAILVGEQTIKELDIGNIRIIIATGNDFSDAIPLFESIYQDVAPFANRVMGITPASKYVVIANSAPRNEIFDPYFSGGVLSRTISIIAPVVPGPEMAGLMTYILTHEYLHLWNIFAPVEDGRKESWYTEGFTDYMAIRLMTALGGFPKDQFLNGDQGILGNYQKYLDGRDPEKSLRQAGLTKNQGSYDHVYSGGFTFAVALDAELARLTNGTISVADYMRELVSRFGGKEKIKFDDLITVAEDLSGGSLRPMFEKYVLTPEAIPLEDYLHNVGLDLVFEGDGPANIVESQNMSEEIKNLREKFLKPDGLTKYISSEN